MRTGRDARAMTIACPQPAPPTRGEGTGGSGEWERDYIGGGGSVAVVSMRRLTAGHVVLHIHLWELRRQLFCHSTIIIRRRFSGAPTHAQLRGLLKEAVGTQSTCDCRHLPRFGAHTNARLRGLAYKHVCVCVIRHLSPSIVSGAYSHAPLRGYELDQHTSRCVCASLLFPGIIYVREQWRAIDA